MNWRRLWAAAPVLLLPTEMPEAGRQQLLAPYFQPAGGQTVHFDPQDIARKKSSGDRMRLRGFIKVMPPAAQCFTITRHPTMPDERICRPTTLAFEARELNNRGEVIWDVRTGSGDFGTKIIWPTPHRIAQLAPIEMQQSGGAAVYLPLLSCKADKAAKTIQMEMANGETWLVRFPAKDVLVPQSEPSRKLFIQLSEKEASKVDPLADEAAYEALTAEQKEAVAEGRRLAKEAEKKANKTANDASSSKVASSFLKIKGEGPKADGGYRWNVSERKSFGMGSDALKIADGPSGLKGTCRYRYVDAPFDSRAGVIECHDTDSYDAVFSYLPCAGELLNKTP